ncbi:NADP-dependent phosphogluconate dehydrogenase [Parahaliea mediterranea]|uniref:NADP-dependent phosphogluconate dehydrogenase n=1 Tax=Parahaliea mediterranea TaxID=651086 RepID=UPI000C0BAD73|nr:NADP-dependent phosphogluconate dehydrogenase [Parahaliea mediterranea]MAC33767.1 phosphogluconate dehydrogenase (NADP(+)-dependent, decarboxylating) [Haliea sp.]|tara:strand:- start:2925 stop:4346 length:1422 start_codon:yes stop_codon:yes gene_type:complete
MTEKKEYEFGVIGMAVMGRNLALNMTDHGIRVAVYNRSSEPTETAVKLSGGKLHGTSSLVELVSSLGRPRKILLMIKAGEAIDAVMEQLAPLLDAGDIVIDGGNSWYEDTRRREKNYLSAGIKFFGVGVSGGVDGARHGPSLMPGGDRTAYQALKPVFEAIAARTESGPCVTYVGPDGAGHFVKMVHNGIEYADMQFIAEAYHLLKDVAGLNPDKLEDVFNEWNLGPLESFLIEITAKIFAVKDPESGGYLVDQILDSAEQKGTGLWTARVALEQGVAIPSIIAAIDARALSSRKAERVRASRLLPGPKLTRHMGDTRKLIQQIHDALLASKVVAYAQGLSLIGTLSSRNAWGIDLGEIARIWKGGCIIRARLLDLVTQAYDRDNALPNLLLDAGIREVIESRQVAWREVVCLAQTHGIPVPAMASGLAYYDSYRCAELPQNLIQAQRDAFGAHTYRRKDDGSGKVIHTEWLD